MFTISPEAFTRLEAVSETEFVHRLARVLRDAVPSLAEEPDSRLLSQVRLLIEHARSFGLVSERAIGSFAVTAGMLGADFVDRFPGARQILVCGEDGDRKGELLEAFTLNLLETLER